MNTARTPFIMFWSINAQRYKNQYICISTFSLLHRVPQRFLRVTQSISDAGKEYPPGFITSNSCSTTSWLWSLTCPINTTFHVVLFTFNPFGIVIIRIITPLSPKGFNLNSHRCSRWLMLCISCHKTPQGFN
jgi:hypothetical protein